MRHGAVARAFVLSASLLVVGGPVAAQDGVFSNMQVGVQSVFSSVGSTTTFASGGAATKTDTKSVYPVLTVTLDSLLYPRLRLSAGGTFELNSLSTTTNQLKTDSTISRNRPFFLLRSTNPVLSPGVGFFRREERAGSAGQPDAKLVNDEYDGYLGWKPAGGPVSDFQFVKTHTFDGNRAIQDLSKDFGSLVSTYRYRNLGMYYRGSYLNSDDQLQHFESQQVSHAARWDYSGAFIQKRLLWNATYNLNYQDVRTVASGTGGEVALPVTPFAGLASISQTPVTATLSQNGFLIDGNLTAGAGIDLGLPATLADAQPRNIGLDFLTPTEVNRFLLWVDRELPIDVTNTFSWDIYSSLDNLIWKRETTVAAAPFGPFENRFQIDFPSITARYIKVVTQPLSAVVPGSSNFPDILVTEMQAFIRRPAGQATTRLTQTTSLLNTDVRLRILDAPSLFYEGSYLSNENSAGVRTDTLSNGLSMNHSFGHVVSVYARGARELGTQAQGDRVATVTSATLTLDPIATLRSSLLYSGLNEEITGLPDTRRGLFVQNAARPYRGVDVLFGIGWNATTRVTGEISHDRLINTSATISPRPHVSLTVSYDETSTERSGTFVGIPNSDIRRAYASASLDPIRTLHLVVGGEVIATTGQNTRTTLDIGVNWAPFPDGTLQFVFASNETLRELEFGSEKNTLGAVRWNVSRRSFIDVSFQRTRSETAFQTTQSRIVSATVRFYL